MINDVVGQLGLFIGWSVITVVEMIILVILLCTYCCVNKEKIEDPYRHDVDSVTEESDNDGASKPKPASDGPTPAPPALAEPNPVYDVDSAEPPRIAE